MFGFSFSYVIDPQAEICSFYFYRMFVYINLCFYLCSQKRQHNRNPHLSRNQQLSTWNFEPLKKREIMHDLENLANYLGLFKLCI